MHSLRKDLRDLVDYDSTTGILTLAGFFSFTLPTPGTSLGATITNVATLTDNITITNPIETPVDGQKLIFRFAQDGTGSRIITWGNAFAFGTDVTATLIPLTASAKWEMVFQWCAGDSKWRAVGIARGF